MFIQEKKFKMWEYISSYASIALTFTIASSCLVQTESLAPSL